MELLIILVVFVLLCASFYLLFHKPNHIKKQQKSGLAFIILIKKLIGAAQQHRGYTAAWLSGDKQVTSQLNQCKQQIAAITAQLSQSDIKKGDRWLGFCDHWQRLLKFNENTSPENSFEQHNMMIRNLAYFLEDTAEQYYLTADYIDGFEHIGYVWNELVLATESIGQSRALGAGVAVKKHCSSVEKIRLNFLSQNIEQVTNNILQQLSYKEESKVAHQQLVANASTQMKTLVSTIVTQLVSAPDITIEQQSYFNLATETLQQLNLIFEHQIEQIDSMV